MLTDTALKHLKSKAKDYKVTDRDGMYVLVKSSGALTFRYDYRINGRRETVTLGQYGEAKSFGEFGERWFKEARMAESTRAMRRAIFDRDIVPTWRNRLLKEITPEDLRALCAIVKDRGAPATAIHVRDIVKQIFAFAIQHGEKVPNPAEAKRSPVVLTERRDHLEYLQSRFSPFRAQSRYSPGWNVCC